jgi:hypothetical protein
MTIQPVRMMSQKFTSRYAITAASAPEPASPPAVSAAASASSTRPNPPGVRPVLPTAAPAP